MQGVTAGVLEYQWTFKGLPHTFKEAIQKKTKPEIDILYIYFEVPNDLFRFETKGGYLTQSWRLPALLIAGGWSSITNISSNLNPKSKRLEQLCKLPMQNRFFIKKFKNPSRQYVPLKSKGRDTVNLHGKTRRKWQDLLHMCLLFTLPYIDG